MITPTKYRWHSAWIIAVMLLASFQIAMGQGGDQSQLPSPLAIATPAVMDSGEPRLVRGSDGTVVLSWLEHDEQTATLKYSILSGDEWLPARTVASGSNWFVNWADFPSVMPISEDLWAAHWLVMRPGGTYAYDVAVALSSDGGETWSQSITPHNDNTPTEHGFVSLFPWQNGVGALWLDGRNMIGDGHGDSSHAGAGGMTLRAAVLTADQSIASEFLVDDLVCDCCQTDVAIGPDGPIAVYRNRTSEEIRDIYVSRVIDGRWQPGSAVGNDNWNIAGCPVNGPAIAASGSNVAVAWFTMANDNPRVRFAHSVDAAANFTAPVDIDAERAIGRVGVAIMNNGDAVVSWLREGTNQKGEVAIRVVSKNGSPGPIQIIAPTEMSRPAGFPQMISDGKRLVFAWTDTSGDLPEVKTAILE